MIKPVKVKKENKYYVDNKKFYEAMKQYIEAYREAEKKGTELPVASNYIGSCISLIAEKLSLLRNFINYSFREEMISDAKENCILYLHKFNPDKYTNPFAYFTQISYYAFIRRIQNEQKQQYIKHKTLINASVMNILVEMSPEDTSHFNAVYADIGSESSNDLIQKFEQKIQDRKDKKLKDIESFVGEDNDETELDTADSPTDDRKSDEQTEQ